MGGEAHMKAAKSGAAHINEAAVASTIKLEIVFPFNFIFIVPGIFISLLLVNIAFFVTNRKRYFLVDSLSGVSVYRKSQYSVDCRVKALGWISKGTQQL